MLIAALQAGDDVAATSAFLGLLAHDAQAHADALMTALVRGLVIDLPLLATHGFLDDAAVVAAALHRYPVQPDVLWPDVLVDAVRQHRDALLEISDFGHDTRRSIELLSAPVPADDDPEWLAWTERLLEESRPPVAIAEANALAHALALFD
jgi:hypothetical protein